MRGLLRHAHDAALLARAATPGACVPGEEELRARLAATLLAPGSPGVQGTSWDYARWKPGHSLTLGWELRFEDGHRASLTWKRYFDGKGRLLEPRQGPLDEQPSLPHLRRTRAQFDERTWISVFPRDRVLRGLPRALDLRSLARDLRPNGSSTRVRWRRARAEVLRYKPERRAVLRIDWDGAFSNALRVLPPRAAQRAHAARRALDLPVLAGLLGGRPAEGLLYEEWLELRPEALSVGEAGAMLALLHAREVPEGLPVSPALPRIDELAPLFECDAGLLRAALARGATEPNGRRGVCHGDFHLDQLGRSTRGPVLLDLDGLGVAPLSRDLCSWSADPLVEHPDTPPLQACESVLEAYARAGGRPPALAELREATAAELVRRAAAAIRRLEAGALEKAERLLACAHACEAPKSVPRSLLECGLDALARDIGREPREFLQRCEFDERGRATVMLALPEGPRWFRIEAQTHEELSLGSDPMLPGAASAAQDLARGTARLCSWRPGRRFVILLPDRVRKGVRAGRESAASARQAAVAVACRASSFRVASLLGQDATRATFDLERLPGRALDPAQDLALAPALARLIEEWRTIELDGLAPHTPQDELALLERLAARHARAAGAFPHGWGQASELLESQLQAPADLVTAHRDLYEAQLLVDGDRLALLDFDLACRAEAELDPANLLAHLDLAVLRTSVGAGAAASFEASLLDHLPAPRIPVLRFYRGASLLRLALIWGVRARGAALGRELVDRCEEVLGG